MQKIDYKFTTLPNGLRVVTVPMLDRQSASVAIWVQVGARYESDAKSGISHLIEHMLFKGTKKRTTTQIKREIEGVGGLLNAYTSEDVTCYFSKLLYRHVPIALDVLCDMINHATIDERELARERTVVVEEIKMYRDLPSHYIHEVMGELLWPKHPLGRPISGTPESVAKITRRDIQKFIKQYYHPQNILVGVSGAVEHAEVVNLLKKKFPTKRKAAKAKAGFKKVLTGQRKPQIRLLEREMEQSHFVIGLRGLSRYHALRYPLGLLNIILGANMSSRLFEEVREKRGLAYEIRSGLYFYQDTGALTVSAGVESSKAPLAIAVVLRELEKFCATKVGRGELRRAKDYLISQFTMSLEDTLDHALWVGERSLDRKDLPDSKRLFQKIEAVKAEDIQKVARLIFKTSKLNLALIGPETKKLKTKLDKTFRFVKR